LDPKGSNSTTDTTDCDKMKEDEMSGAYSMHGTGTKHIKMLKLNPDHLQSLGNR
jgi:hypothetical protein